MNEIDKGHPENWRYQLVRSSRSLFHNKRKKTLGLTHGGRLCGDRIEGESVGAQETVGERVSNQSEQHRGRFGKEYHGAEPENMLGERQGYRINTILDTLTFSLRVWGLRLETQCKPQ